MPTISTDLRNKLEKIVSAARNLSERAAKAALEALAVAHHEPYGHMTAEQRNLRNKLRARARQLGDTQDAKGQLVITHLAHECAYEHWHRMLFARFLAENNLLMLIEEGEKPIAVSLEDCKELAKEAKTDLWTLAGRYAQKMLPKIFRPDLPAPRPKAGEFCVYVHRCCDNSFYIGQTDDFPRRLMDHEQGKVSWTAPRLPIEPIH
ncbi:MAG: hypothetical protein L0Z50_15870, partial [Verrucomicrobiales bacterium]|nr:hypothetical protein [Verrucomicrobiales bacterium]